MILSGCRAFYPNLMFKSDEAERKARKKQPKTETDSLNKPYIISRGDKIELFLFSNRGYKLVDVTSEGQRSGQAQRRNQIEYLVQRNGYVKVPIIDSAKITGLSIQQAEQKLEKKYRKYINDPFVILNVTNRRVFVFIGGERGQVVPINNENTTLVEVLAQAGGIPDRAKAYRIKIIRGNLNDPIIKYIDLSTIKGMKQADLSVQANDIVYVEPVIRVAPQLLKEIGPWVQLITSVATVIFLVSQLQNSGGQ
jgi:polysaccharide export outer membrane protein